MSSSVDEGQVSKGIYFQEDWGGGRKLKRLLNTLYITSSDRYLSLDGENVVVLCGKEEVGRIPLHNLEAFHVGLLEPVRL